MEEKEKMDPNRLSKERQQLLEEILSGRGFLLEIKGEKYRILNKRGVVMENGQVKQLNALFDLFSS